MIYTRQPCLSPITLLFKIAYMKSIILKCLDMILEPLNQSIFKGRNIGFIDPNW